MTVLTSGMREQPVAVKDSEDEGLVKEGVVGEGVVRERTVSEGDELVSTFVMIEDRACRSQLLYKYCIAGKFSWAINLQIDGVNHVLINLQNPRNSRNYTCEHFQ